MAAMAINVLKSIRPITKVAKKSTIKVEVTKEGGLYPSITSHGKNKKLCLRTTGTNARYTGSETLIGCEKVPLKTQHVFRFIDENSKNRKQYLIVAPNIGVAKRRAKQIAERRGMRYSGLAKRAIGILMYKTNTKRVNDGTLNPVVENTANSVTRKSERVNRKGDAGTYTLTLSDNLRYALKAIKGGKASFDV